MPERSSEASGEEKIGAGRISAARHFASLRDPFRPRRAGTPSPAGGNPRELRQDILHHLAVNIRQPEVAALEAIGEPLVIEAEQMQDCRL